MRGKAARRQEKGAARSGDYGQAWSLSSGRASRGPGGRTHDAKDPGPSGCVAAGARGVAALDRNADTLFARLLADRLAATQRSRVNMVPTCSKVSCAY